MRVYRDIDNDSGVTAYDYGDDFIVVRFKTGIEYTYTYKSAGRNNIEMMKRHADSGDGLNSFINTKVRTLYEK